MAELAHRTSWFGDRTCAQCGGRTSWFSNKMVIAYHSLLSMSILSIPVVVIKLLSGFVVEPPEFKGQAKGTIATPNTKFLSL